LPEKTRVAVLRALLLLLLGLALAYRLRSFADAARVLADPDRVAVPGFAIQFGGDRVFLVGGAAEQAGLRAGDRVVSIDGEPYTGRSVLGRALARGEPGEPVRVGVRRGAAGETLELRVPLQAGDPPEPYFLVTFGFLNPSVCLALGFGVAWPRDPRAWALLLLLIGFTQISDIRLGAWRWGDVLRPFYVFWDRIMSQAWAVGMLLFGVYFPDRLALDRRLPWLKQLLIVPIVAFALPNAVGAVIDSEAAGAFPALFAALRAVDGPATIAGMAAIGCFFASIGYRMGTTEAKDARRRLKLLNWGAMLGLTPIWLVVLRGIFTGRQFGAGLPEPVLALVFGMLAIFPVTLAYVIVVERAMDVRVVVRQGLQYALARRGIAALQIAASVVVMLLVLNLVRDPNVNRPQSLTYLGWGVTFIVLANRVAARGAAWIDRRFFREAVDAERVLSELSDEVRTIVEQDKLLDTVARRIADALHVPRVAVLLQRPDGYGVAHAHGFGADVPALRFAADGRTAARLRETKDALRVHLDDPQSWVEREAAGERPALQALHSELLLPLQLKDSLLGFLSLGPKQSEEPYSPADVRLLRSVASQTAFALENSRLTAAVAAEVARAARMSREIEIAKEVQEQLFPQNYPKIPGLDIAGFCRPAAGVGGDYYDFLSLKSGGLGVAIGDISGKGVPAALLMAGLQASLRGQTLAGATDLAALMENVNLLLVDASPANRYATFFYGQYDPKQRLLRYVNAGHNAPMLFRGGEVIRLAEGGPVVGLLYPAPFQEAQRELRPGDLLVGFTDGISECMNEADEEWGEARLMQAVAGCADLPAREIIGRLMAAADAFADGARQHDDMTLVVVKLDA
jgi:sigma-B regulation protein RsbU (phosphoserine phosphatase)